MENFVIIAILVSIVAGIVWYLLREKKRGTKCIGCPYAKACGNKCSCGNAKKENELKQE